MNLSDLKLGWFDFMFVILLAVGCVRGRKRGMTEEFPNLIQWIFIVAGGAALYKPLGRLLSETTGMGRLFWFVAVYLLWAALVKGITTWVVRSKGDKLGLADMFGSAEYPLGMISGMIRVSLTCVFFMALLNARLYTSAELSAMSKFQEDNFGSISLPTLGSFQRSVFYQSALGKLVKDQAELILIEPTPPREISGPTGRSRRKNAMDSWS
jgi:uncharacterized membrane protein required for colicin V production